MAWHNHEQHLAIHDLKIAAIEQSDESMRKAIEIVAVTQQRMTVLLEERTHRQ